MDVPPASPAGLRAWTNIDPKTAETTDDERISNVDLMIDLRIANSIVGFGIECGSRMSAWT
jgi:hypothetical protein